MKCLAVVAAAVLLTLSLPVRSNGEEPSHYTYAPAPPGTIVDSRVGYLGGEAMHSQWRTVISKRRLGSNGSTTFYQWYLSFYAIDGSTYRLRYQSPRDGGPFAAVTRAHGAQMWFPYQSADVVGMGEFMGAGAQQAVVSSHETGADCGTARINVYFEDAAMRQIMPTLSIENACSLDANIVRSTRGDVLRVTGPYYAPDAPLCCPTKPKVTATFRFVPNHGWTQQPKYFSMKQM